MEKKKESGELEKYTKRERLDFDREIAKLKTKFESFFGPEKIEGLALRMTSEDFSFYSQTIPVCFFRLGVGNKEKGIIYSVHHPKFDIDSACLKTGILAMIQAAL